MKPEQKATEDQVSGELRQLNIAIKYLQPVLRTIIVANENSEYTMVN